MERYRAQELPAVQGWSFGRDDATHLLHLQQARALVEALAAFFARHPLA
jgi:hypothetical protein